MENPWQDPSEDMLNLIVSKVSYFDLRSFSAVCSSWRRAAKTYRRFSRAILLSIAKNQTDGSNRLSFCLRTMSEGNVSPDATIAVVSLSDRYHKFYCIGWSKEMLVLADMETRTEIAVIDLFHQLSFCLPPLTPGAFWTIEDCIDSAAEFFEVDIEKVVVLVTLAKKRSANIVLAAIFISPRKCLAWCRGGSWALLGTGLFIDIVARERQLFALDSSYFVVIWDFNLSNSDPPTMVMRFQPCEQLRCTRGYLNYSHFYLVKSIGEEFLLVERYLTRMSDELRTTRFHVYKSRLSWGEKWVEVDSLVDDNALFLGCNESVSVSIRDLPEGYEGNSIYFTQDFCVDFGYGSHEMGVYNMEHKNIKFFHSLDEYLDGPTPIWMVLR